MRTTCRPVGRRIALTVSTAFVASVAFANAASAAAPTYSQTVLGDSPLVFYKLDESAGAATAANAGSLGASADGAYRNSVRLGRDAGIPCEQRASWRDGGGVLPAPFTADCYVRGDAPGSSAYFSGAPYNPQVQASIVPESTDYTLEAWVRPAGANSSGGIVDHGDNGVLALDNGAVTFIAHATDGNAVVTGPVLPAGAWRHVVGTWDNTSGTATLYVDGVSVGSATKQPLASAAGSPSLYVGWTNQNGLASLTGNIDDVAYYGSALSGAAIANHYAVGSFTGGGATVQSLTPEPGSAFNATSTKWGSTFLDYNCTVSLCAYSVSGPGPVHTGDSGGGSSVHVPLPNDGPGTYTVTVTAPGVPNYVATTTYTIGTFSTVIGGDAPTAWWRFDEADGIGTAADSAPGGLYDGVYENPSNNGGIGISGDGNAAREFKAGDGGYVGVNGVAAKTEAYTIELWFKTSDADPMALFDHGATGGGPALYLEGGLIKYRTVDGQVLTAPYTSGAWTHVAATWDGVTARLYKDGSSAASTTSTLSPSGTPALYLGFANVGLASPAFRGLMDEVSYYGTALSADRVHTHYLADPPAPAAAKAAADGAPVGTTATADSSVLPAGTVSDRKAASAAARAKATARAKARARARAKALAKARARAKARAKARHHSAHRRS